MAGGGPWVGVAVGLWLVAALAFGCSGTNLVGDAGDVPLNPADTVGNPCSTDTECDDGEPCNGLESCNPETGRCVGGAQVTDFTQCTTSDGRYASCVDGRCDLDYEEMFVPAGPFVMGCDPDEPGNECPNLLGAIPYPEHEVVVSGFFIDRYEVTNARYRRCEEAGACVLLHDRGSALREPYLDDARYALYPVISVDQSEADGLCQYEGKRLPTEAEWEKAARGGCELVAPESCGEEDERRLPWDDPPLGDAPWTCEYANSDDCFDDTNRAGAHPLGRSPYGVEDMLGNVEEWTAGCLLDYAECAAGCTDPWLPCAGVPPDDPYAPDVAVARGGSFMESVTIVYRDHCYPVDAAAFLGFRCARPTSGSKSARHESGAGYVLAAPSRSARGGRHEVVQPGVREVRSGLGSGMYRARGVSARHP